MKKRLVFLIFGLLWGLLWGPALLWGGTVLPLRLGDLVSQAGKIFVGNCIELSSALDEHQFPSVWIRYRVITAVKGVSTGETVLVKQFGSQGSIECRPGEELLLFFYPDSDYGFTSPVGLGQGKMGVQGGTEGGKKVSSPYPHLQQEVGEENLEFLLQRMVRQVRHEG